MTTYFYLKLYLLTIPLFFAIDLLWLGVLAKNFYQNNLSHLLSPAVNWPAALLFYFMYIAGIILFAVKPGLDAESLNDLRDREERVSVRNLAFQRWSTMNS